MGSGVVEEDVMSTEFSCIQFNFLLICASGVVDQSNTATIGDVVKELVFGCRRVLDNSKL